MSKKSLLLVAFLCASYLAVSQEIVVGVKGGMNQYTIGDVESKGGSIETGKPNEIFSPDKVFGTQFGGFVDVSFGKMFLRPEVLFTTLKSSYAFPTAEAGYEVTRMDIPILLGLHVYGPLSIVMGPVFSNVSDLKFEGLDDYSPAVIYDESLLNFQAGIMLEMGRFGVDLRYEHGLKKSEYQENLDFTRSTYGVNLANLLEYNSSQLIISVHVNLLRINSDDRKRRSRSDWRNHRHL